MGTVTGQPTPDASPSASASADPSASASASAGPSASASSTDPASCIQAAGSNPLAILTCVTPAGGTNPLTGLITQLQGAAGGGVPGLSPAPFTALASCVQTNLTAVPPDGTKLEACFSTFAQSLTGAPQATCLDPLLQGAIGAVQDLVEKQNPAPLQGVLTGLPATLTTLASCLSGSGTSTTTPTPTATATTGTTTQSGGATTPSDPAAAVPVASTPTFTG